MGLMKYLSEQALQGGNKQIEVKVFKKKTPGKWDMYGVSSFGCGSAGWPDPQLFQDSIYHLEYRAKNSLSYHIFLQITRENGCQ